MASSICVRMVRVCPQAMMPHPRSPLSTPQFRRSSRMPPVSLSRRSSAIHCSSYGTILSDAQLALNSPLFHEYGPLVGSLVPVGVAMLGCKGLGMGIEKDFAIAVSRSSIQLFVLAFALKFVFEGEKIVASLLAVSFMVLMAGHTAGDRAKELPRSHLIATSSLALGTLGVLGLMVLLKASPITPRYIIPTAGYVIGNSMSMVGATMQGLKKDILHHKGKIEAALALGATPQQAVQSYIQRAVMQGMAPWIDSIKTAGLITIPGSMTGMLMVGMRPMDVVRIQVQLLYMLLGAAALSSAISSYLGCGVLFSKSYQLASEEP